MHHALSAFRCFITSTKNITALLYEMQLHGCGNTRAVRCNNSATWRYNREMEFGWVRNGKQARSAGNSCGAENKTASSPSLKKTTSKKQKQKERALGSQLFEEGNWSKLYTYGGALATYDGTRCNIMFIARRERSRLGRAIKNKKNGIHSIL